jgi:acetyl-CoA C-acetyltransferase
VTAEIIGWSHGRFGKRPEDLVALITEVVTGALDSAGLAGEDIDEVVVGHFNGGMDARAFVSSIPMEAAPGLRFRPATRVENACATGSAAVAQARTSIEAGKSGRVLVVGVEKMTGATADQVGAALLGCDWDMAGTESPVGFAGVFAQIARTYFAEHGDQSDAMAAIAAKNHRNGVGNPYAQIRRDLGFEHCSQVSEANPMVAAPLRRTDCSPVSDGAAALVLAAPGLGDRNRPAARVRAMAQVSDFLPASRRDLTRLEGAAEAMRRCLAVAGTGIWELDLLETHDCFTVAELIQYEAFGLCEHGQGGALALDGALAKDGKLPVNPSGGLKAKGHPVGATGVSQHVLAAMQVTGNAGEMQVPGATLAGVFNMGGTGVANYATVLEGVR